MSRAVLLLACATSLMGCILRDFDYEEPTDIAPAVESSPTGPTPLNRIVDVDLTITPGGDAGAPNEVPFEAEIREVDVDQALEARVYLDHRPNVPTSGFLQEIRPIPPVLGSADDTRRRLSFTIPRSSLSRGCHLVELLVAGEFQPFPSREPRELAPGRPGGLGAGAWWIVAFQGADDDPIDMRTCPPE